MRILGIVASGLGLLLGGPATAQTTAPFCLVSETGQKSCFYYSLQACQQAAQSLGGMCAANGQTQAQQRSRAVAPNQQFGPLDAMMHIQDAGEAGRRAGEARAQARMQQQAVEDDLAASPPDPPTVPRPDGTGAGMIRACRSLLGQTPPLKNEADTYVDAMQIQHCRSFIAGYHFARSMAGTQGEQSSKYCLPQGTTNEEIYAAVAFAPTDVAPGVLAAPEGVLVAGALARRFPCP
ncbi:DUF3551 domain-containing protein [bacterium BD-1]|nr:DUF3551 domain-containing protein [Ottowia caeni]